jgi:hypothetical protein
VPSGTVLEDPNIQTYFYCGNERKNPDKLIADMDRNSKLPVRYRYSELDFNLNGWVIKQIPLNLESEST